MTAAMPTPTHNDWVKTVLFDRGYLSRIRGEAIKVYLAIIEACGGLPDRSVTISLSRPDAADPAVVPDGDRLPGAAGGPRPGRVDDPSARQGQDLLRLRPARRSLGLKPTVRPFDPASEQQPDSPTQQGGSRA